MKHFNLPQKKSKQFYQLCQQQFLKLTRQYRDIQAVYGAGTLAHPGISDLDFILVLKNKLTQPLDIETRLTRDLRQVIGHGSILKINNANASKLKIIDDFPLQHLQGQPVKFQEYQSPQFELCRILDWLPERLVHLVQLAANRSYDATRALQVAKSITISLKKLDRLTNTTNHRSYIKSVERVRSQWFKNTSRGQTLDRLLSSSLATCLTVLNQVDDYVRERHFVNLPSAFYPARFSIPNGPAWHFAKRASLKGKTVYIPYTLALFLLAQAQSSPQFMARQVRAAFSPLPRLRTSHYLEPALLHTINQRMAYLEKVAQFFRRHHLTQGFLKYGWFLYA